MKINGLSAEGRSGRSLLGDKTRERETKRERGPPNNQEKQRV